MGVKELADARWFVREQIERGSSRIGDLVALARLDALLEVIDDQRVRLAERQRAFVATLLESDDPASLRPLLAELDAARAVVVIAGLAGLLGLLVAGGFSRGLSRPVRRLLDGTRAVQRGRLDTVVPVTSRDAIGLLTRAFNAMVAELKVKAQIKETFGEYIDPRIVQGLIERPELAAMGGERRVMTVLFCDMKDSTGLGERTTPGCRTRRARPSPPASGSGRTTGPPPCSSSASRRRRPQHRHRARAGKAWARWRRNEPAGKRDIGRTI